MIRKVGVGGGCHWCTEAVFASLKGVVNVEQGWIASQPPDDAFSEAVSISYNTDFITLHDLIEIHLYTHSSTSLHSLRNKYRSAIYCFSAEEEKKARSIIQELQTSFEQSIITQVLPFMTFKESLPEYQNYYYSNPDKPFCTLYIHPKIRLLKERFSKLASDNMILP